MKRLILILLLLPLIGIAQQEGIKFQDGLNWQQIKAKAKAENKSIFMDCFATWCIPCKYMEVNIFSQSEVGDLMNKHFICVKVQMDKTGADDQDRRNWYEDAAYFKNEYKINAYPTYLFFSPDGKAIHQFSGSSNTAAEFFTKVSDFFTPSTQYFTMLQNWKDHTTDSVFMLNALIAIKNANDLKNANLLAGYYINSLKQPITKRNIVLLYPLISSEKDNGFQWYLHHAEEINQVIGYKDYVERKIGGIIFEEEIMPVIRKNGVSFKWANISNRILHKYSELNKEQLMSTLNASFQDFIAEEIKLTAGKKEMRSADWQLVVQQLNKKFPDYNCERNVLFQKMKYYYERKSWAKTASTAIFLIDRYGSLYPDRVVNDICWNMVFLHSDDKTILAKTLSYMEKIAKNNPEDLANQDTYANLLYKTGQWEEAIYWENKVISMAKKRKLDESDFRNNLIKMQNKEPTWEGGFPVSVN